MEVAGKSPEMSSHSLVNHLVEAQLNNSTQLVYQKKATPKKIETQNLIQIVINHMGSCYIYYMLFYQSYPLPFICNWRFQDPASRISAAGLSPVGLWISWDFYKSFW